MLRLSISTLILVLNAFLLSTTVTAMLVYRTSPKSRGSRYLDASNGYKKTTDLVESFSEAAETHEVTTEDGYIITLHRIPPNSPENFDSRKIVLLQHGIAGSSDNWLLYGRLSLAGQLARNGYDVWLGNTRGSSYSRRHVHYKESENQYWQFSFHEHGYYDLASFIDYILNATGEKNLFLIGHSAGTTMSYVLLSLRPEYNEKVRLLISYAPVAYVRHAKSPLIQPLFKQPITATKSLIEVTGQDKLLLLENDDQRALRKFVCADIPYMNSFCRRLFTMFTGKDYMNNQTIYNEIFTRYPDGVSEKEILHFVQIGQTDIFGPYDLWDGKRPLANNSVSPNVYPLHQIRAPAAFYYTNNDNIVSRKDMEKLIKQIRNVVGVFKVPNDKFCHMNFIIGATSNIDVFRPTIELMGSYLPSLKASIKY